MPTSSRSPSLLVRLSLSAVAVVLLSLGIIGFAVDRAFLAAERQAQRERLEAASFAVLSGLEIAADGELSWNGAPAESLLTQPGSGLYAGVYGSGTAWLSPSTIGVEIDLAENPVARGESSYSSPDSARPWTVYRLGFGWETGSGQIIDLVVWAAEDPRRITQSLQSFRGNFWRWLAIAAGVLLFAQMFLLAQPLLALRRVARDVHEVELGARDALGGRYPRELKPLTDNLNALLAAERANAERYSHALGDLAHSLKTPLAVLQAQADASESVPATELRDTVRQMQHRVRTELDRAARSTRRAMQPRIDVKPTVERMLRSLARLYPDTEFEFDAAAALRANIDARDLLELLGNLLENAAKYGGGKVRLELTALHAAERRRTGLRLIVDDNGAGLDPGRFEQLLQRGQRGDERAEGQGLGLAIVQRIVESYHGRIRGTRSPLGGLRVELELDPG